MKFDLLTPSLLPIYVSATLKTFFGICRITKPQKTFKFNSETTYPEEGAY
jgi:hypothetical protein